MEEVQQRAAAAALAATLVNKKELVDDKAIAAVGSKCSRMTRNPHQNTAALQVQDGIIVSPPCRNQHVADTNTSISFRVPDKYTSVEICMLLARSGWE